MKETMFIATLVAREGLSAGDISIACDVVEGRADAVRDGVACDVRFVNEGRAALEAALPHLDVIVQREADRHRTLLVADMDSTMITVECIDELADYVGLKTEVAAITERAMRGELDFAEALHSRVSLLAGLPEAIVAECLRERVKPMSGAIALIAAFRAAGGRAILVSGGFTHFTYSVAAQLGFDRAVANQLGVADGTLTGKVLAPIVDGATKRAVLLEELAGRAATTSVAIGDGANDIPMIEAAGLGIAYHAKPITRAAANAHVRHGDLGVVRYSLGLDRDT